MSTETGGSEKLVDPNDPQGAEIIPTGFSPQDARARMVTRLMVYHQDNDSQPVGFERQGVIYLDSHEQPYVRKLVAGKDWAPIDLAWLGQTPIARILLTNEEGKFLVRPTPEEKKLVEASNLLLGVMEGAGTGPKEKRTMHDPPVRIIPFAKIRPQDCMFYQPVTPDGFKLMVRATVEKLKFTLVAIPA